MTFQSLLEVIKKIKTLNLSKIRLTLLPVMSLMKKNFMLYEIASSITAFEKNGFIHGDLHPGNVLIKKTKNIGQCHIQQMLLFQWQI